MQNVLRLAFAVVLISLVAGCGGGPDYEGSVDRPAGYTTYRADGVSFVRPSRFQASSLPQVRGLRQLRFAAPSAQPAGAPFVLLGTLADARGRFDSLLAQERSVVESAGGKVDAEDVDVPGAVKAVRSKIESTAGGSEMRSQSLDLLLHDGTYVSLTAGAPKGRDDAVDVDAVLASVRVEGNQ